MREIIFDTETTGLDPATGDRVVEIGCIEVIGRIPTGRTFHTYCNPERSMPAEAARVHGLVDAFLADKPLFSAIADDFLAFVGDSPLVAHNAAFDMKFINAELARCGRALLPAERAIDTVLLCRKRFPGGSVSLDVMCQRFGIDRSRRVFHGALLDAELLAEVYIELHGGRQIGLSLAHPDTQDGASRLTGPAVRGAIARPPRIFSVPPAEQEAHDAFIAGIANALWHSDRASAAARRR